MSDDAGKRLLLGKIFGGEKLANVDFTRYLLDYIPCQYCGQSLREHPVATRKCLFDATHYKPDLEGPDEPVGAATELDGDE